MRPVVLSQIERERLCGEDRRIDSRLLRGRRMASKQRIAFPAATVKQLLRVFGSAVLEAASRETPPTNTRLLKCLIAGFGFGASGSDCARGGVRKRVHSGQRTTANKAKNVKQGELNHCKLVGRGQTCVFVIGRSRVQAPPSAPESKGPARDMRDC